MLKDILEFFKREKLYALFFVILTAFFAFSYFHAKESSPEKSEKLREFERAEKQMQEKVKESGSFEKYLKDRPRLSLALQFFSLLVIAALFAGFVLDFYLIKRPGLAQRFTFDTGPPRIAWKVSMVFKVLVWFFIVNIALAVVLGLIKKKFGWSQDFFMLFHTSLAHFVAFGLIYRAVKKEGGSLRDVGFRMPENVFKEMGYGWLGYLLIIPVFAVILAILIIVTKLLHYEPPAHPLVNVFLDDGAGASAMIIYSLFLATVMGPIFEEIFFRGFCYPAFKQRFGKLPAMVLTSAFFAFIHDNTFAFWPIFALGMGLCFVYEKRFSLIPSITLHITHNALFIGYFFLAKDLLSRELG